MCYQSVCVDLSVMWTPLTSESHEFKETRVSCHKTEARSNYDARVTHLDISCHWTQASSGLLLFGPDRSMTRQKIGPPLRGASACPFHWHSYTPLFAWAAFRGCSDRMHHKELSPPPSTFLFFVSHAQAFLGRWRTFVLRSKPSACPTAVRLTGTRPAKTEDGRW